MIVRLDPTTQNLPTITGPRLRTTDRRAPTTGRQAPMIPTDSPTGMTTTIEDPPTGPRRTTTGLHPITKKTPTQGPFTTMKIATQMTTDGRTPATTADRPLLMTVPPAPMTGPKTPTRGRQRLTTGRHTLRMIVLPPTTGHPVVISLPARTAPTRGPLLTMTDQHRATMLTGLQPTMKDRPAATPSHLATTTDPLTTTMAGLPATMTGLQATTTGRQTTTTDLRTTIGPPVATTDPPVTDPIGTKMRSMTSTGRGLFPPTLQPRPRRTPRGSSFLPSRGLSPSMRSRR